MVAITFPVHQTSFKITTPTKDRLDLVSSALGVDKSVVVERALADFTKRHKAEVDSYLERIRQSLRGLGDESPGELLTGKRRRVGYRGGAIER